MKLVKTVEFDIDTNWIIKKYKLTSNSNWDAIMLAVRNCIACYDDDDFYDLIDNNEDKEKIAQAIAETLKQKEEENDAAIAMRESLGENWW